MTDQTLHQILIDADPDHDIWAVIDPATGRVSAKSPAAEALAFNPAPKPGMVQIVSGEQWCSLRKAERRLFTVQFQERNPQATFGQLVDAWQDRQNELVYEFIDMHINTETRCQERLKANQ